MPKIDASTLRSGDLLQIRYSSEFWWLWKSACADSSCIRRSQHGDVFVFIEMVDDSVFFVISDSGPAYVSRGILEHPRVYHCVLESPCGT